MYNNFQRGTVIYADRGAYQHYGVYVGDNEVVHFNTDKDGKSRIIKTSLIRFALCSKVNKCYVTEYTYDLELVACRAESKLGSNFGGYDFITNNCEHFTSWCACGERISIQAFIYEDARTFEDKFLKKAEKVIAEPAYKFCDAGIGFCEKCEKFTNKVFDKLDSFFSLFD